MQINMQNQKACNMNPIRSALSVKKHFTINYPLL